MSGYTPVPGDPDADQAAYDAWAEQQDAAERRASRFYREAPAEGPVKWNTGPGPVERLASTVAEVRALRILAESTRRDALHAAALVYQGRAHDVGTDAVLEAAADFEAYLRGDEVPTPVVVPPRPLVELGPTDRPVTRVAGYTFDDLRALDAEAAERLAVRLDAALAEDRVERGTRPLVRTALAILRRQR